MSDKIKLKARTKMDLTGQKFGRWTVLGEAPRRMFKGKPVLRMWLCQCTCGKIKEVHQSLLRSGKSLSCGCIQKEITIARNKSLKGYNKYDLTGEYGIGWTSNGTKFIFDLSDYSKIKEYRWNVNANGYIVAHDESSPNRKTVFMHRIIMDCSDKNWKEVQVDHVNLEVTDNRRCNLRLTSASENGRNKRTDSRNVSGCPGVTWDKGCRKWRVRINTQSNVRQNLGVFENLEEAIKVRKEAEQKIYGSYSRDASIILAEKNKINNE